MAVKMVALKCPQCGADLEVKEGRQIMYCMYCGAKIVLDNENEYIYRYVDEAALEKAETDRMLMQHELEMEKLKETNRNKRIKRKIIATVILAIIGLFLQIGGEEVARASGDPNSSLYEIAMIGMFVLLAIPFVWLLGMEDSNQKTDKK